LASNGREQDFNSSAAACAPKSRFFITEKIMYVISPIQRTIILLQKAAGRNLLLSGAPGSGKTQFAYCMAADIGADIIRYDCRPDKERDMLYDFDVSGIIKRTGAYVKGAIWRAFEASHSGRVVVLLDEVDKSNKSMDAFLLRILEECAFDSPDGDIIEGNRDNLIFVLTSNGRREIRPEVLRRTQRFRFELPEGEIHRTIVATMTAAPNSMVSLACRVAESMRKGDDSELWASPKEVASLCNDLMLLPNRDKATIAAIVTSYMVKSADANVKRDTGFDAILAFASEMAKL